MNDFNTSVGSGAQTDVGLRTFMLGTYRYMAMAMLVTAGVAYFVGQAIIANPQILSLVYNPVTAIATFLIIVFGFGAVGRKLPSMSLGGVGFLRLYRYQPSRHGLPSPSPNRPNGHYY